MDIILKELFEYNHWCNKKLIALFIENREKVPQKSLEWFSHIINAHQIWNSRIDDRLKGTGVWDKRPLEVLADAEENNFNAVMTILKEQDLEKKLTYTNSQGNTYSNTIRDVLIHVANHSTYHRGQIASDLKNHGITPLITDFIAYKR